MTKYHKINGIYKRDMGNKGKFIMGQYSRPEFEYLADNKWTFTEKVDGTNMRVIWNDGNLEFRGKSDNADFFPGVIELLSELFTYDKMYANEYSGVNFTIYGEAFGAGINKGGGYGPNKRFIMFDVMVEGKWLPRHEVFNVAAQLGVDAVPIVGTGTLQDGIDLVKGEGYDSYLGNMKAEGVVAEPEFPMYNRYGERIITKLKTVDFKRG